MTTPEITRINIGDPVKMPEVSVVIPHLLTYKSGNIDRLTDQIKSQSLTPLEIVFICNVKPNGRARNIAVNACLSEFIILMDDYTLLGHDRIFENLVNTLRTDPKIGIVGVSKLLPPDANRFTQRVYDQMPRTGFPIVSEVIPSDMATTTCMAMRRSLYLEVGGQNTSLIRGTDPELRYKVRHRGLKVVIAADTWCYKPQASTLKQFILTEWRRGLAQGWAYWEFPELMFQTPDDGKEVAENKVNHPNFLLQLARYILGIPWACIRLKPLLGLSKMLWCSAMIMMAFPSCRYWIGARHGVAPRNYRKTLS